MALLEKVRVVGQAFELESGAPFNVLGRQDAQIDAFGVERLSLWNDDNFRAGCIASRAAGDTVIRPHITYARFMTGLRTPNVVALQRLRRCAEIAEEVGIRMILTLNSFWVEETDWVSYWETASEGDKWASCAVHAGSVAEAVKGMPSVLALDLVNEPATRNDNGSYHGGNLSGAWFVLYLATVMAGRTNTEVADAWLAVVGGAVRRADPQQLITVGMLPTFGDFTQAIAASNYIDFVCLHEYQGTTTDAAGALTRSALFQFWATKPIVWEEFGHKTPDTITDAARRGMMIDATQYGVSGFFCGGAGLDPDPDTVDRNSLDKNATRYFIGEPQPEEGLGVAWLAPIADGSKTQWSEAPAGPAYSILRGQGEVPPDQPDIPPIGFGGPVATAPIDRTRKVTATAAAQVTEVVFAPWYRKWPIRRVELWTYLKVPGVLDGVGQPLPYVQAGLSVPSMPNDWLAVTSLPAGLELFFSIGFEEWRVIGYNGSLSEDDIDYIVATYTSGNKSGQILYLARLKVFYELPVRRSAGRLGRIKLPAFPSEVAEQLGGGVGKLGAAVTGTERRLRSIKLELPIHGTRLDPFPVERADQLRRQIKSLLGNEAYRQYPHALGAAADPNLQAYVVLGEGELSYAQGGPTLGDYKLSLNDLEVIAPRGLVRAGRRVKVRDLRAADQPRDYLKRFYSADYANAALLSLIYLPIGATAPASDTPPVPAVVVKHGIDGQQPVVAHRGNRDVVHYELNAADEGKGDVICLDTRGIASTVPLTGADARPQEAHGWEEVYGPDHDWLGTPVLQNGMCRVRWASLWQGRGYLVLDGHLYGSGFAEDGAIGLGVGGSGNGAPLTVLESVTLAEYTTDRAVLQLACRDPNGLYRGEVYVTLQRGWSGPRVELYMHSLLEVPGVGLDSAIRWIPASPSERDVRVASTGGASRESDSGTWGNTLINVTDPTQEPWAAMIPHSNGNFSVEQPADLTCLFAFVEAFMLVYGRNDSSAYGATRAAIEFLGGQTGNSYCSVRFTIPATQYNASTYWGEAKDWETTGLTASQVADAAAASGQAVEDTQAAFTNHTLETPGPPGAGVYSLFAKVKAVAGGATVEARGGFTGAASTTSAGGSRTATTFGWVYLGDATKASDSHPLFIQTRRSAGSGAVRIERFSAVPVEQRFDSSARTGGGFDGARDVAAAQLNDCQQVATIVARSSR